MHDKHYTGDGWLYGWRRNQQSCPHPWEDFPELGGHEVFFSSPGNNIHKHLRKIATPAETLKPNVDDIVILHLSIGSDINDWFLDWSGRKMIIYHNITPADYFKGVHPALYRDLRAGAPSARNTRRGGPRSIRRSVPTMRRS